MCGIIGYVGHRASKPLLLQGLERLEYRGYDSAGIALLEADGLDYVRAVGNLANLKRAARSNGSSGRANVHSSRPTSFHTCGIGSRKPSGRSSSPSRCGSASPA